MKIYLCGAIHGVSDQFARGWRDYFHNEADCQIFGRPTFVDPMKRDFRGVEAEHTNEIVDLDKWDIQRSDIIVAHAPVPSWGTAMEIFYAWTLGKPILVVSSRAHNPWLAYHSTKIVATLEDAQTVLKEWTKLC